MSKYCMVALSNHFDHCMVATVKLEQLAFFLCFVPPSLPGNVPLVEVVFFQRFASPSPPSVSHTGSMSIGHCVGLLVSLFTFCDVVRLPAVSIGSSSTLCWPSHLCRPPPLQVPGWPLDPLLPNVHIAIGSLPHMQDQLCRVDGRSVGENVDLDTGSRTQGPPRLLVSLATWPLVQTGGSKADRAKSRKLSTYLFAFQL